MNWQSIAFDWNQVRAFLVTAEEGSLSRAARALGLTQPTLSRQVAALEEHLDVTLFERAGRTLVLTETGASLLQNVREMGEAANAFSLAAGGRAEAIEGRVTITATDMASAFLLPAILKDLAETAPGIQIDIVASNDVRDLQRREADIALRNAAPTEPDLIARRLKSVEAVFAVARSYLGAHGPIDTVDDLQAARWIGYGRPEEMIAGLAPHGVHLTPDRFRYQCEAGLVVWEMVKAGLGVAILIDDLTATTPDVVRLLPDRPPIEVPFYLVTHSEMRKSQRLRVVWDAIARALG
jgi:DNA-binding transcriptional LysR family regulator